MLWHNGERNAPLNEILRRHKEGKLCIRIMMIMSRKMSFWIL
jgi:hypothetical protein